jgi:hypothetical protein
VASRLVPLLFLAMVACASTPVFSQDFPPIDPDEEVDPADQPLDPTFDPEEEEFGDVQLRPFETQRADTILLDSVTRGNAWWTQLTLAGSIYDARRDVFIGRWSPSIQGGYRFDDWGIFGTLEFDQTFDFTLETDALNVMDIGIGAEFLSFVGHVRTSIAVGATVLMSDTSIDESGEIGWFVDFRPGGLRWGFGDSYALEVTPISLDILVPITKGIPLAVYSYMTLVAWEFSL